MNIDMKKVICRFKITLMDVERSIWRRIEVPGNYNFWDLHVAIQDAMGWADYHLHEFRFRPKHKRKDVAIGIPDADNSDGVLPGWEHDLSSLLDDPGMVMQYCYDFGDDWRHEILFEGIMMRHADVKYPRCLDGAGACPPEDVGGVPGHEQLLQILASPAHPEYQEYKDWLNGHINTSWPYDPDRFDANAVIFDNPKVRFKKAFR